MNNFIPLKHLSETRSALIFACKTLLNKFGGCEREGERKGILRNIEKV